MIRPITIVTFLMACGSGLYLYQSKHEVQLLDRTIEKSVRDTTALREQSRLLSAEWTMLNDPDRLRQFSDTYLSLKTINPAQFTSLNDLDNRLPAPRIETPAPAPVEAPVAGGDQMPMGDEPDATAIAAAEQEAMPLPPIPAVRPAQVATPAPHPSEAKVAIARPPVVAEVKPAEARPADARTAPRLAEVRPEVRPEPRVSEPRMSESKCPSQGQRSPGRRWLLRRSRSCCRHRGPSRFTRRRFSAAGGRIGAGAVPPGACRCCGARTGPRPVYRFAAGDGAQFDASGASPDAGECHLQRQLSPCHERSERSRSAA